MIVGRVTEALDALVPIRVLAASAQFAEIDAVVDTGFNGTLAISKELAEQLRAAPAGSNEATLADGRIATLQCSIVSVEWHGVIRELAVRIIERGCLAGMELLSGSRLEIDVAAGGEVLIQEKQRG
jgi:clan AA aspartic protease